MENFCNQNNDHFIVTKSYENLCTIFRSLKKESGKIIHVIGAPGTGKSVNIYSAINELDLNYYSVKLNISEKNINSKEVFNLIFKSLKQDLEVKSRKDIYKRLSEFDLILIADDFHDSHRQNPEVTGFSQWSDQIGVKAFKFYLYCIWEYLNQRKDFKHINLVFQTSWRIYICGVKYDLFSDLGVLSRFLVYILNRLFTIVEITYSKEETIAIVKNHIPLADEDAIMLYIEKYGCKPRLICNYIKTVK